MATTALPFSKRQEICGLLGEEISQCSLMVFMAARLKSSKLSENILTNKTGLNKIFLKSFQIPDICTFCLRDTAHVEFVGHYRDIMKVGFIANHLNSTTKSFIQFARDYEPELYSQRTGGNLQVMCNLHSYCDWKRCKYLSGKKKVQIPAEVDW